eukprot:10206562-Prorocentrum_lima.AAC.1
MDWAEEQWEDWSEDLPPLELLKPTDQVLPHPMSGNAHHCPECRDLCDLVAHWNAFVDVHRLGHLAHSP